MTRQNLVWAGPGTFLYTQGAFNILALNAGYEYFFGENLSLMLGVEYWISSSDNYAGLMSALLFHPSASGMFDFYAGAGFAYGIFINQALKTIDFPAVIGCNFMITREFGVRLQDKIYLLSLNRLFNELDLAAVYRF